MALCTYARYPYGVLWSISLLALAFLPTLSHATDSLVDNLRVHQLRDGSKKIEITYDVLNDSLQVNVQVSVDTGRTWSAVALVEGDTGRVAEDRGRRIIWNIGVEPGFTNSSGHGYRVRLTDPPPGMARIPAGEFIMGSEQGEEDERPVRHIKLDGYYVDLFEVTVSEYAKCVEAHACPEPRTGLLYNWGTKGQEGHPINGVSWDDASSYCEWVDKRLPTEAEWEKAARGLDGRTFPWGEGLDEDRGNYWKVGSEGTVPAGSYSLGVSPFHIHDMAGNVLEWVEDWYDSDYYDSIPTWNPVNKSESEYKVLRGGSWFTADSLDLRTSKRFKHPPQSRHSTNGFRCIRTEVLSNLFDWDTESPAIGEVDVDATINLMPEISVRFDSAVDTTTLKDLSNILIRRNGNEIDLTSWFTASYFPESLLLQPQRRFTHGDTVLVALSNGVKDDFGNELVDPSGQELKPYYSWTFIADGRTPNLQIAGVVTALEKGPGWIAVSFFVEDQDSDALFTTSWQFSVDQVNWLDIDASAVEDQVFDLSAERVRYQLYWNTREGENSLDHESVSAVWFRMKVRDADANTSTYATSPSFAVVNNVPPKVELHIDNEKMRFTDSVPLITTVDDVDTDSVRIEVKYSLDRGRTWMATTAGDTTISPGLTELVWRVRADLGSWVGDVKVAVVPSEETQLGKGDTVSVSLRVLLGDGNRDGVVDLKEVLAFLRAWNTQDPSYDIGPVLGQVPNLRPSPDGRVDFEDLTVLAVMWHWSAEHPLERSEAAGLVALPQGIDEHVRWEEYEAAGEPASLLLRLPEHPAVAGLHLDWAFDAKQWTWQQVEILEPLRRGADGVIVLSHVDAEAGRVRVDIGRLGGSPVHFDGEEPLVRVLWSARGQHPEAPLSVLCQAWDAEGRMLVAANRVLHLRTGADLPSIYSLEPAAPNPFNPYTLIAYQVPQTGRVRLAIHNVAGQLVRILQDGVLMPGYYQVAWNGRGEGEQRLASGVYFVVMDGQGFRQTRRITLLR